MQILIINSGSSSIKFQVVKMPGEEVICKGLVERIGLNESEIHYKSSNGNLSETKAILSHEEGLNAITKLLMHPEIGVLKNTEDIDAVSHRVVHGGNRFDQPTQIDQDVLAEIDRLSSLAPLHNPANIKGIKLARSFFNTAKQVAIFDTAFHQTLPEKALCYSKIDGRSAQNSRLWISRY